MKRLVCFLLTKTVGLALVLTACSASAQATFGPPHTPEIDAGSAASALTLLVGGAMLMKDRFFSK